MIPAALIDDLSLEPPFAANGASWRLMTDAVMGGISQGRLTREIVAGQPAVRLRGEVSLANEGGFVQMVLDFAPDSAPVDASRWHGLELDLYGDGEAYGVHLRTDALTKPWQSYRQGLSAAPAWRTYRLAFADFLPHRTATPLDVRRLRRVGLVAIGRAFAPDLALGALRFMSAPEPVPERTP